jgi:hypothetical protein
MIRPDWSRQVGGVLSLGTLVIVSGQMYACSATMSDTSLPNPCSIQQLQPPTKTLQNELHITSSTYTQPYPQGAAIATENIRINTLIVDVPLHFIHVMA